MSTIHRGSRAFVLRLMLVYILYAGFTNAAAKTNDGDNEDRHGTKGENGTYCDEDCRTVVLRHMLKTLFCYVLNPTGLALRVVGFAPGGISHGMFGLPSDLIFYVLFSREPTTMKTLTSLTQDPLLLGCTAGLGTCPKEALSRSCKVPGEVHSGADGP